LLAAHTAVSVAYSLSGVQAASAILIGWGFSILAQGTIGRPLSYLNWKLQNYTAGVQLKPVKTIRDSLNSLIKDDEE
ncbi:MAG: hypothetical protein ACLFR1_15330, partial [Spirochaetia bacterium]